MTFEKVWEKLKAEDTTGAFAMAEKLSLVSVEAIEYAFNSGYAEGLKAERPQGEWIGHIQYCKQHNLIPTGYKLFVWCNRCNCPNEKKTKFCPNCGAEMKGGAE